ncbi:hypothetical protein Desca_2202 [Desulfotomaculum nigrificans CO-1-SRB]|uniref:Replication-relaxation n=1 Tax=Desulfotomaculum nigrificans (strain DSM 14880 / VKM B-2319 / CO-1-SRB) TaxID=868595 RepID=F6B2T3_DESCC|nr:hypothetical protein [Desulfotomaculum nigrificans]AEF95041.1 hypothetical protein Desca_2202 [Desulfotomaculum nigrificans CO-1-SRB]
MVITERDKQVLLFLAKWRFATIEQFIKAKIFQTSRKRCYNRLLQLCKGRYIQSHRLARGQMYYHLLPDGAEMAGLNLPWYSRMFKGASDSTVVQYLVWCDYAQACNISYLSTRQAFQELSKASYDTLKRVIKGQDRFYYQNDILHALVADFGLSTKYLSERAAAYSKLPAAIKDRLTVVFLVFNDTKRNAVARAVRDSGLRVKLLKAKWKY